MACGGNRKKSGKGKSGNVDKNMARNTVKYSGGRRKC